MADLSTAYLGLKLRNPIVAASSNLTSTIKKILACEKAGLGALVLKSLFEEQVRHDTGRLAENIDSSAHSDAHDIIAGAGENHLVDAYLKLVEEAKKRAGIPVIASLHCLSTRSWVTYARRIEAAGADALELNLYRLADDPKLGAREVEGGYHEAVKRVAAAVSIPVAVKLGPHFDSLAESVGRFRDDGATGVTLFNRYYRPDVDIESLRAIPAKIFSSEREMNLPLQWISLLSGRVQTDFAASTGVHDAPGVIKQLLVGAKAVQLCTALYESGLDFVPRLLAELSAWMLRHGFGSVAEFNGMLCRERCASPRLFEQNQYIQALVGIS